MVFLELFCPLFFGCFADWGPKWEDEPVWEVWHPPISIRPSDIVAAMATFLNFIIFVSLLDCYFVEFLLHRSSSVNRSNIKRIQHQNVARLIKWYCRIVIFEGRINSMNSTASKPPESIRIRQIQAGQKAAYAGLQVSIDQPLHPPFAA